MGESETMEDQRREKNNDQRSERNNGRVKDNERNNGRITNNGRIKGAKEQWIKETKETIEGSKLTKETMGESETMGDQRREENNDQRSEINNRRFKMNERNNGRIGNNRGSKARKEQ